MNRPVVMVTGSNRNTGLGIIRFFAQNGWDVVAACRNQENAEKTVRLLNTESPDAEAIGVWFSQEKPEEIKEAGEGAFWQTRCVNLQCYYHRSADISGNHTGRNERNHEHQCEWLSLLRSGSSQNDDPTAQRKHCHDFFCPVKRCCSSNDSLCCQ